MMRAWAVWGKDRWVTLILFMLFIVRAGSYLSCALSDITPSSQRQLLWRPRLSIDNTLRALTVCKYTKYQHHVILNAGSSPTPFRVFIVIPPVSSAIHGCLFHLPNRTIYVDFVLIIITEASKYPHTLSCCKQFRTHRHVSCPCTNGHQGIQCR